MLPHSGSRGRCKTSARARPPEGPTGLSGLRRGNWRPLAPRLLVDLGRMGRRGRMEREGSRSFPVLRMSYFSRPPETVSRDALPKLRGRPGGLS